MKNNLLSMSVIGLLGLLMFSTVLSDTCVALVPLGKPVPSNASIAVEKYVWDGSGWVEADSAPGPSLLASAGSVQFNVTVTNTGNVALSKVTLTDTAYPSSPVKIGNLAAGASYKVSYSSAWSDGNHAYSVSAKGVFRGKTYSASDSAYYFGLVPNPQINVVKTANLALAQIGETVTYTFTVTNKGNVPLSNVTVNDSIIGTVSLQSGDTNGNGILETTETWIFAANWTVESSPDPLMNTATATGYYGATPVTDTDSYSLDVTEHGPTPSTLTSPNSQQNGLFGMSVATGSGYIVIGASEEDLDSENGPWAAGRVYVYNATTRELIATLTSPHAEDMGEFGGVVAVSGQYLLVSAIYEDCTNATGSIITDAGRAYVYSLSDLAAAPLELTSPNPVADSDFGCSLGTDGTSVFVGAPDEDHVDIGRVGTVHIFALSNGSQVSSLNPPILENGGFGSRIVVSGAKLYVSASWEGSSVGAVYVYNATTRDLITKLTSPTPQANGFFGSSLTVGGGYIFVGSPEESPAGEPYYAGQVHVFNEQTYAFVRTIVSPNPTRSGSFGVESATDGTYLVIGASSEISPEEAGKAYVYLVSFLPATPIILTSPNPEAYGYFAAEANLIATSNGIIVIGAPGETVSGNNDAGHVYVYTLETAIPEYLTDPSGGWTFYGLSVAVGEGYIVVGAPYETVEGAHSVGRAYVYNTTDGTLAYTLDSQNQVAYGDFGYSVAVGDGVIIVGAPQETASGYAQAGNAYVYNATNGAFVDTLTSDNPEAYGNFGLSVGVGAGIIIVGAPSEASGFYPETGRVYVYNLADRTPATFSPLITPNPIDLGRFGFSVAVGEGFIVVAATYEEVNGTEGAGRVYVYNTTNGVLANTLVSSNPAIMGCFGWSVAVGDGVIIVGAPQETSDGYSQAGNAYIYDITDMTTPTTLSSISPQTDGWYGRSVAVGDGLIIVGASSETSGGYAQAGNVYIYDIADMTILGTLTTPNPGAYAESGVHFGDPVAVGEAIIAVGATGESYSGGAGKVYLYPLDVA